METEIIEFLNNYNNNSFMMFVRCFSINELDLNNKQYIEETFLQLLNDKNNKKYLSLINQLKEQLNNHQLFNKIIKEFKSEFDEIKVKSFFNGFGNVNFADYHQSNFNHKIANFFSNIELKNEDIKNFGHLFDWLFIFYSYYNYPKYINENFNNEKVKKIFEKQIVTEKLINNETFIAGLIITENFELFKTYKHLFSQIKDSTFEKVATILNYHYKIMTSSVIDYKHKKIIEYLANIGGCHWLCMKLINVLPNKNPVTDKNKYDNETFKNNIIYKL